MRKGEKKAKGRNQGTPQKTKNKAARQCHMEIRERQKYGVGKGEKVYFEGPLPREDKEKKGEGTGGKPKPREQQLGLVNSRTRAKRGGKKKKTPVELKRVIKEISKTVCQLKAALRNSLPSEGSERNEKPKRLKNKEKPDLKTSDNGPKRREIPVERKRLEKEWSIQLKKNSTTYEES